MSNYNRANPSPWKSAAQLYIEADPDLVLLHAWRKSAAFFPESGYVVYGRHEWPSRSYLLVDLQEVS